jgi:hypothetical protein
MVVRVVLQLACLPPVLVVSWLPFGVTVNNVLFFYVVPPYS